MKKTIAIVLPFLAFIAIGCGDDTQATNPDAPGGSGGSGGTGGTGGTGGADAANFPAAPILGAQIDRMGRPGINTALTDPFWDSSAANQTANHDTHLANQDAYNQQSDPTMWAATMIGNRTTFAAIKANLAIIDGLDGTCGNQLAYNLPTAGSFYTTLASVIVDDELYIDTTKSQPACGFLGIEAKVVIPSLPASCGGRQPQENVIDPIYSALAAGAFTGVSNGITTDVDHPGNGMTFPWLGDPN